MQLRITWRQHPLRHVVFQLGLRAEHFADTERAVGAFEVALEGRQQLQLDPPADDGVRIGNRVQPRFEGMVLESHGLDW